MNLEPEPYIDCVDGITFWIWDCADIAHMPQYPDKVFALAKDKPVDITLFDKQLSCYFESLKSGRIEGLIVCASTLGDADPETNRPLKTYIARYENDKIQDTNPLDKRKKEC